MDSSEQQLRKDFLRILAMGSERAVAELGRDLVNRDPERLDIVYQLCFTEKYPIAMRAARVVQFCVEQDSSLFNPYLGEVVSKGLTSEVEGVRRAFLKLLAEQTDLEKVKDGGILLDRCFEWISDASENPAIRIYSMTIVHRFSIMEPDLKHELKEVLRFLPVNEKPSIRSRVKNIMKEMGY